MNSDVIYLDNHATTPLDPRVFQKMIPWMTTRFGNAHSKDHVMGEQAADAVEEARRNVASLIATEPDKIFFTSGATESIILAIEGFCQTMNHHGRKARIALPPIEHLAVLDCCRRMERCQLAELHLIGVDSCGRIDLDEVEKECRHGLDLLCVMGANNEIGNIYPLATLAGIAARFGVSFFSDSSQYVGHVAINLYKTPIDYLAISGHKLYGPKGIGALFIRDAKTIAPPMSGGGQEMGVRPGTLNVPGIVGLGEACRLLIEEISENEQRIAKMRDSLQKIIFDDMDDDFMRINGDAKSRLAGNLHISMKNIPNVTVLLQLRNTVAISSGAACSSGSESPSHVLDAMKMAREWSEGSLRIGVGKFNTELEIEKAGCIIREAIVKAAHGGRLQSR